MYDQYNAILASDYNSFIGSVNGSTANTLNAFWGVGNGNIGYGQSQITQLGSGDRVNASNWNDLFTRLSSAASQQGTSITSIGSASTGDRINYISTLNTDLTNCYTNRLNAIAQGTTISTVGTRSTTWSNAITFTHTITFSSGDSARYFFNTGGQISVNFAVTGSSTPIGALFSSLATASGTIYLSSPSTGTVSIGGTNYTGITKIGGSGSSTLTTGAGYYALTTVNTTVFNQIATGLTPSGYTNSFIQVDIKTNGAQGSNGDNGNVITVTTTFDEVPNNLVVDGTTTVNCVVRPPSTTYLTNVWGTPTVGVAVQGS